MTYLAMDNFEFAMTGYGLAPLVKALECLDMKYSTIEGWRNDNGVLHLYWSLTLDLPNQLIIPVKPSSMAAMIEAWLQAQTYPREPDHDGHNSKGWKLATHKGTGLWSLAFTVQPVWAMHGK
jgi:hypothetical protein